MEMILCIVAIVLVAVNIFLTAIGTSRRKNEKMREALSEKIQESLREEMRQNREELGNALSQLRSELTTALNNSFGNVQKTMTDSFGNVQKTLNDSVGNMQDSLHRNFQTGNEMQKEKFEAMAKQQDALLKSTEKRLDDMRNMVDEKLQKTLEERIGKSFELVRNQLESVQKGLGEMQNLAQDVGGLKRVLSNVKTRGTFGEVQLGALLEQILSPEQYATNVKPRPDSSAIVEFVIKLPNNDGGKDCVYLPIDAKFPKDVYEQYQDAVEAGDASVVAATSNQLETTIKKMAKDIHDKYIFPPYTTDFAIMFLPFESIYAEVIRRTELMETLQRNFKVVVTGPTTLGAILNSLQMGFRTLAIQKRSSEVWAVLAGVKTEFNKFGGMLAKVQNTLNTAGNQLEEVIGKRTRAIERKLRTVEELPPDESAQILNLPEYQDDEETDE